MKVIKLWTDLLSSSLLLFGWYFFERLLQTDRKQDRQTGRGRDREGSSETEVERETNRQIERQTDRERNKKTGKRHTGRESQLN